MDFLWHNILHYAFHRLSKASRHNTSVSNMIYLLLTWCQAAHFPLILMKKRSCPILWHAVSYKKQWYHNILCYFYEEITEWNLKIIAFQSRKTPFVWNHNQPKNINKNSQNLERLWRNYNLTMCVSRKNPYPFQHSPIPLKIPIRLKMGIFWNRTIFITGTFNSWLTSFNFHLLWVD